MVSSLVFLTTQAAALPALLLHKPGLLSREHSLRPAGEDVLHRHPCHRAREGGHQRLALRPVRRLALAVPLQDRQDVTGQHLPGVQGEKLVSFLCNPSLDYHGPGCKSLALDPTNAVLLHPCRGRQCAR